MSSSVDERIVKLGFDNGKFEKGVSQSMSTLDKLEEKLKFKHAEEGTKNIQRAFDRFDFSVMSRGIESLERRFSTMGIAGMNVVNKVTDSIIGAAKKIESATIGQIKAGGWSRAMNLANAQFQIEGLGEDWNEMQKAISYGVKDTAYGLDAAASAASSLVASGVAYKESINGANDSLMHTSLRAISGVAAMTNSSYEDISRIFTTVAGNGRLMGDQLLQLSSRGLNVAANLANAFGKTEAEIRDMVSHGQIDFETFATAMDDAFGAHAKEANKTFTGALSNMKAALSRFGAVFATPVIEKTNTLFISLTSRIDELKGKLNSVTVPKSMEELHKELDNLNLTAAGFDAVSKSISEKTIDLGKDFADMWQSGIDAFSALVKAVDLSWFDTIVEKVDIATNKVKWFFDTLKDYLTDSSEDTAKEVNDAAKSMIVSAEEAAAARDVIAGKYGTGASRANKLKELFGEQSAKNIQTYVNAVAAAGWDYEKSAVKIEEASEKIELSEEELAKKEKLKGIFDNLKNSGNNFLAAAKNIAIVITSVGKAIFKGFGFNVSSAGSMLEKVSSVVLKISYKIGTFVLPLLNSITVGVSNLWRATKTVGGSLKTILSSIFAAFSSVFKIDTGSISKSIVNVTEKIRLLSEKIAVGENGAKKIQAISEKIFQIIKKAIDFIKRLSSMAFDIIDSLSSSQGLQLLKEKMNSIIDLLANADVDKLANNPIGSLLKEIFDGVSAVVKTNGDLPSKLTGFINAIVEAIKNLKWGSIIAISGAIFVVTSIARLIFSINSLGKALDAVAQIPMHVANFFSNTAETVRKIGNAVSKLAAVESIWIVAKSIALLTASIFVLSLIDEQKLFNATAVIVVIGVVLAALIKSITRSMNSGSSSILRVVNSLGTIVAVLYAVSGLIVGLAGAVLLVSMALAIISKIGDNIPMALLTVVGIISLIGLAVGALMYVITNIKVTKSIGLTSKLAAVAAVIVALSVSVLIISAAMAVMSKIPAESFGPIAGVLITLFGGIAAVIAATSTTSTSKLLSASVSIIAMGIAISLLLGSLSAAMVACASALKILESINGSISPLLLTFVGILSAIFLFITGITELIASSGNLGSGSLSILSIAVVMFAIGSAMVKISESLTVLSSVDFTTLGWGVASLSVILAMIVGVINSAKNISAGQMLMLAALFIFIQKTINTISNAVSIIAKTENTKSAILSLLGIIAMMAIAIAGISAVLGSGGSVDGLDAVGKAFIEMSIGIILIAVAIRILADVQTGLVGAVIAIGALVAVVVILGALASKFPKMADGLNSIGKAFLYVGIGALLVGASMYLVAKAFLVFSEALAILVPNLDKFFSTLENHKWAAIGIGAFIIIVLALVVAGIVKLVSLIEPLVTVVTKAITTILDSLGKFADRLSTGTEKVSKTISTKTKTAMIGIFGGILAAIAGMTPETLETIGELIIKVLKWLGTIAGDVAEGLVNFLIEVINGVADAIMNNSSRIWAALKSVLYAIADLVLQIFGGIIAGIADKLGAGDTVRDFINGTSEELMRKSLETRKAAEASAEAKKEVYNNIRGVADDAEDTSESTSKSNDKTALSFLNIGNGSGSAADEVEKAMGRITNVTGQTANQVEENLEKQREALARLKATAYYETLASANTSAALDAAKRSLMSGYNKKLYENSGKANAKSYSDGFNSEARTSMMPDMDKYFGDNSEFNLDMSEYGAKLYNPEAYSETMDANMEQGIISSITDHKEEVETATRTSVTDTINAQIEGNRGQVESVTKYMWRGFFDATDKEKPIILGSVAQMVADIKKQMEGPDGLDEHSPSKVAYGWGKYLVMGLSNGVKNSTALATDSMSELSDAMIVSFGAPLDYLAKIASGEFVYDPSIRPVIDASSIRSGASSINSMIGAQQIQLSGYSGQLAADISQLDNSNLMVVNELRQLREDMAAMTEEITNMQMVMDTGALVGQISGPIDRSLGRNAVRRGRGN